MNADTKPGAAPARPGPKTPGGKAVAARNATSHGLFARDVVLPRLGEDPAAYNELFLEFCDQLAPQNLLERHYVEKIAAASWRLRRLHRWQAQVYEDPALSEDERIAKLDKVHRQETTLHRQIDQTVRLLNRDVPQLFARRALALAELDATEADCKHDPEVAADVERITRTVVHSAGLDQGFDLALLDTQVMPQAYNTRPVSESALTPPIIGGPGGLSPRREGLLPTNPRRLPNPTTSTLTFPTSTPTVAPPSSTQKPGGTRSSCAPTARPTSPTNTPNTSANASSAARSDDAQKNAKTNPARHAPLHLPPQTAMSRSHQPFSTSEGGKVPDEGG